MQPLAAAIWLQAIKNGLIGPSGRFSLKSFRFISGSGRLRQYAYAGHSA